MFALDAYLRSGRGTVSRCAAYLSLLLTAALLAHAVRRAGKEPIVAVQVFLFALTARRPMAPTDPTQHR